MENKNLYKEHFKQELRSLWQNTLSALGLDKDPAGGRMSDVNRRVATIMGRTLDKETPQEEYARLRNNPKGVKVVKKDILGEQMSLFTEPNK